MDLITHKNINTLIRGDTINFVGMRHLTRFVQSVVVRSILSDSIGESRWIYIFGENSNGEERTITAKTSKDIYGDWSWEWFSIHGKREIADHGNVYKFIFGNISN